VIPWILALVAAAAGAAGFIAWRNRIEPVDPHSLIITPPDDGQERFAPISGSVNFRDVGGYRTASGQWVRRGLVYRSGMLSRLTDADLDWLQGQQVKWVCDLRSQEEVNAEPDRVPPGAVYSNRPLTDPDENRERRRRLMALLFNRRNLNNMMPEYYQRVALEANAALYGDILRHLSDPQHLPAIIHCTAGKDRTGVGVALLLAVLGVPEETIVADYSLSNQFYNTFREYSSKAIAPLTKVGVKIDDIQPLLIAHPNTIRAALAHIRNRYGSVDRYLIDRAGLDEATLERLRATFLQAPA
jgi:protein-tyrosine phosphatase